MVKREKCYSELGLSADSHARIVILVQTAAYSTSMEGSGGSLATPVIGTEINVGSCSEGNQEPWMFNFAIRGM